MSAGTLDHASGHREIADLIGRYFYAQDAADMEQLLSVFTSDAAYDDVEGLDAIRTRCAPMIEYRSMHHVVASQDILVDGDKGRARTFALSYLLPPTGDLIVRGLQYWDEVVRTEDGWRFSRKSHAVDWEYTNAIDVMAPTIGDQPDHDP